MSNNANIVSIIPGGAYPDVAPPAYNHLPAYNPLVVPAVGAEGIANTSFEQTNHVTVLKNQGICAKICEIFTRILIALFGNDYHNRTKITQANHTMLGEVNKGCIALKDKVNEINYILEVPQTTTAEKVKANLLLAKYQLQTGKNKEATETFAKVEDGQKAAGAHYLEGRAHQKLGMEKLDMNELAKAVLCYEKALKASPDSSLKEATLNEIENIRTFVNSNNITAQNLDITEFSKSSRLFFLQAEASKHFGEVNSNVARLAQAHYFYDKVIDTCKDKSFEKAKERQVEILEFLKTSQMNLGEFYNEIGNCYVKDQNLAKAREFYLLAAAAGNDNAKAYLIMNPLSYLSQADLAMVDTIQDKSIKDKALIYIVDFYARYDFAKAITMANKLTSHKNLVLQLVATLKEKSNNGRYSAQNAANSINNLNHEVCLFCWNKLKDGNGFTVAEALSQIKQ